MPRKNAKRNVKKSKITKTSKSAINTQKFEKDFAKAPSKLAAQLSKEIKSLKQKENKLKTNVNKFNSKLKSIESRVNATSQKTTATGKKQFKAAKKIQSKTMKDQNVLNKQLQNVNQVLETLLGRHAKLTALSKNIAQFEKDWSQNSGRVKAAQPAKTRVKKEKVKQEPNVEEESSPVEKFEENADDIQFERTTTDEIMS